MKKKKKVKAVRILGIIFSQLVCQTLVSSLMFVSHELSVLSGRPSSELLLT